MKRTILFLLLSFPLVLQAQVKAVRHVILIGVDEMEIPWIIYGRDVKKGKELSQSIMTYDTEATIAWIFGLKMPQVWVGRPVKAAFIHH